MSNNSNSASYTSTATVSPFEDRRSVTDGGALSINGRDGGVLVNNIVTDQGAIVVARDIAMTGLNNNAVNFDAMLKATQKLGEQGAAMAAASQGLAADIASRGLASAEDMARTNAGAFGGLLDLTGDLFKMNNATLQTNAAMAENLASSAASAYSDATAQANGTKTLVLVGVAVVGIVAAALVFRRN